MKTKHKFALVAAGVLALGTLALLSPGKAWRLAASYSPQHADPAARETGPSARAGNDTTPEAFDRILIRNIATVPFVALYDLLRSAPPKTRDGWIKQLNDMPDGPQRNAALSSFYKTLVQIDPRAAAESVAGVHGTYARSLAVDAIVGAAPLSAMGEMANMLIKLPPEAARVRRNLFRDVLYDWSAVDPVATAHFIEEHPDVAADLLLSNWARVDPDAAKAWLERQPASLQTDANAIDGLVAGWFERDEANALAFVVAHAREESFTTAIGNLADSLFHRSPDEARTFLLRLPKEARGAGITEIVSMTTGVVLGLPGDWGRLPKDVANWILTLPEESWSGAMEHILENWERRDETELANWINQLPAGTRDQVAVDYCSASGLSYPEQAIAIGLTITDASLREQSLRKLMSRWSTDSFEEALSVLQKVQLTEAQMQYLVELLPRK